MFLGSEQMGQREDDYPITFLKFQLKERILPVIFIVYCFIFFFPEAEVFQ